MERKTGGRRCLHIKWNSRGTRTANKCFNCETQVFTRQKKIKCEENNQVQSSKVFNPMKVLQLAPSSEKNTSAETTLQNDKNDQTDEKPKKKL